MGTVHVVIRSQTRLNGNNRLQPARLLCPWDSPGENAGVGCQASSRASSRPRDGTRISTSPALAEGFFTTSATWGALMFLRRK